MPDVSGNVLTCQSNCFAFSSLEHVRTALGLNAAFQFVLAAIAVLVHRSLVGLRCWSSIVRLAHSRLLVRILSRLLHAGR